MESTIQNNVVKTTIRKPKVFTKRSMNLIMHEKTTNEKGQRRTIAAKVIDNKMSIGVSICGPRDQFNKKLGRVIATGRAEKNPVKQIRIRTGEDPRVVFFRAIKKHL